MYTKIKAISLVLLPLVALLFIAAPSVSAQEEPGSVCLRAGAAGSSDYASCFNEIESGYNTCASTWGGPGSSGYQTCVVEVVNDFFEPVTVTPGVDENSEEGSDGGDAPTNGPVQPFEVQNPADGVLNAAETVDIEANPIYKWLITVVNFLSIGVGIVATISVAIAGIQYTVSRGDPNKTAAAVNRIVQAGIAIVLYVFGWTLLNWLIPGGVI